MPEILQVRNQLGGMTFRIIPSSIAVVKGQKSWVGFLNSKDVTTINTEYL